MFEQDPSEDRPEGGARRECCRPNTNGDTAFPRIGKDPADERERGRRERRTRNAEQRTRHDQHLSAHRVRRDDRDQCESRCTTEQELLVADPVAEAAHADRRAARTNK